MSGCVHGLGQAPVAPTWPSLALAELTDLSAAYPDLGQVRRVDWHSPRPFAASGLVTFDTGRFFVKRHAAGVRNVGDLRHEHDFMAHLRRRGVPVPAVVLSITGATAVAGPAGTYEVHSLACGEDTYRDAPSWTPVWGVAAAHAIGAALARLHEAAAGYVTPPRTTRLLVAGDAITHARAPLAALEAWVRTDARLAGAVRDRPWRQDFNRVLLPWLAALRPHLGLLAPIWVHGDFHASNLLWRDGAVSAVLDFGLCNRASAAFDLATAIERNAIAWLRLSPGCPDIGHADLACALVEGYCRVAGRPPWLAAMRHLLPVVHVEFALSELAYFHAVTGSREDAALAYDGFLLGHAAWFASDCGKTLLDRLP